MKTIRIADNLFVEHTQSAFIGGDCLGEAPESFRWELSNVDSARFVTDSFIKYAHGQGQVALLLEPFSLHPENYLCALLKPFDAVLTHSKYWANNFGWLWYPHGGSWIAPQDWGRKPKSQNVSILTSDKNSTYGHKLRRKIAEKFKDRVTVLGLETRVRAYEAYAPFRFSIVVENESGPGYFTEKLIDCLCVGTIPIYWGCEDVYKYFDPTSIICVHTIHDVEKALETADELYYRTELTGIERNILNARKYRIVEDNIFRMYPHLFEENL